MAHAEVEAEVASKVAECGGAEAGLGCASSVLVEWNLMRKVAGLAAQRGTRTRPAWLGASLGCLREAGRLVAGQ